MNSTHEPMKIAQAVRDACIQAAIDAHESAGISGLCHEGRWEIALDAMKNLELERLLGADCCESESDSGIS